MNKQELITHLKNEGFSRDIIRAFEKVSREKFIPEKMKSLAYYDEALPLENGATISQPTTIAFMLTLLELKKGQKILEIGSGSGYVIALMNEITKGKIYGIEIIKSLAQKSKARFKKNKNIKILNRNGENGLPEEAPFDRMLISASADKIPKHLYNQLKPNGILVTPVKYSIWQIKKTKKGFMEKEYPGFVFIPLISKNTISDGNQN